MTCRTVAATVLACSWLWAPVRAQEPPAPPAGAQAAAPAAPAAEAAETVDASKLFNMARLQRQLQQTVERQSAQGRLAIRYEIDVFAQAPRLMLFNPEYDLRFGPVPFTAPTHSDMMRLWTPKEFSAPFADFSNLLRWSQGSRSGQ